MKNSKHKNRSGFTLLELLVTTIMLAAITTSSTVIVRTAYTAWNRHEDDLSQRQQGLFALRHIVREIRQARAVQAISPDNDNSGSLTLISANNTLQTWEHNATSQEVLFGSTTADQVLATDVLELNFVGFNTAGVPTTDPGLIHSIRCTARVNVARPDGPEQITASSQAWLRAW